MIFYLFTLVASRPGGHSDWHDRPIRGQPTATAGTSGMLLVPPSNFSSSVEESVHLNWIWHSDSMSSGWPVSLFVCRCPSKALPHSWSTARIGGRFFLESGPRELNYIFSEELEEQPILFWIIGSNISFTLSLHLLSIKRGMRERE